MHQTFFFAQYLTFTGEVKSCRRKPIDRGGAGAEASFRRVGLRLFPSSITPSQYRCEMRCSSSSACKIGSSFNGLHQTNRLTGSPFVASQKLRLRVLLSGAVGSGKRSASVEVRDDADEGALQNAAMVKVRLSPVACKRKQRRTGRQGR